MQFVYQRLLTLRTLSHCQTPLIKFTFLLIRLQKKFQKTFEWSAQYPKMFYHIQTLDKAASNFLPWNELVFKPDQVKFILHPPLHKTPLPADVQEKFNSVVVPKKFEEFIEGIRNLKVYEDDVWVLAFPRTGSNWTQEAVWQICNGVDTDNKGTDRLKDRFPVIEYVIKTLK